MSPVAKYYSSGAKPVSLLCSSSHVRAWPKGTGDCKFGLNYAAAVAPQMEAAQKGYQQVLWLLEDELTEVGMMNCFVGRNTPETGEFALSRPARCNCTEAGRSVGRLLFCSILYVKSRI